MSELIAISQIKQDAATQPRITMNMAIVEEYAESMKTGGKFPAMVVFRIKDQYILVDGYHRLLAAQTAGIKKYLCDVHDGTMRDAILYAAGVNSTHGLRRSNADKRRAVERLLNDKEWSQWSDAKIAEICHVSNDFVGKIRAKSYPTTDSDISTAPPKTRLYTTKTGKVARMNVDKIGKKDPVPVPEQPKPAGFFDGMHDGQPVDPPKTVAQIDQEQVRKQEIAEAAKNQPAFTTAAELPVAEPKDPVIPAWSISTCREGKCPDGKRHVFKDPVRGQCCDAVGSPINQLRRCVVAERMKKPYQDDGLGNKIIKPGGIRIVKTPLTCEELNRCVDDLIERSGFFTPREVGMVDELVRAHYENIHTRADFLKKAANWFLTQAGEET